jgi:hypothetical protein
MPANYFYQVVYCNERPGRAFRLEYAVSERSVVVVGSEPLPPGYEMALDRMSASGDLMRRVQLETTEIREGAMRCPFCGNIRVFICACGAASCRPGDKGSREHYCPRCRMVAPKVGETGDMVISASGVTEGRGPYPTLPQPQNYSLRRIPLDRTGYVPAGDITYLRRRPSRMRRLWNWFMQPVGGGRRDR